MGLNGNIYCCTLHIHKSDNLSATLSPVWRKFGLFFSPVSLAPSRGRRFLFPPVFQHTGKLSTPVVADAIEAQWTFVPFTGAGVAAAIVDRPSSVQVLNAFFKSTRAPAFGWIVFISVSVPGSLLCLSLHRLFLLSVVFVTLIVVALWTCRLFFGRQYKVLLTGHCTSCNVYWLVVTCFVILFFFFLLLLLLLGDLCRGLYFWGICHLYFWIRCLCQ